MKRRFFALLCAFTITLSLSPAASALEGEALRAADTLAALELVEGYGGSAYATEAPATRIHGIVLLTRLSGASAAELAAAPAPAFRDTPAWAKQAVGYAVQQGWITGVTPQSFAPEQPLTANAACTMLLRLLGYSDRAGDFSVSDAALFARRIGLTPRLYEGELTRGDLFCMLQEALTFPRKDGSGTLAEGLVAAGICPRAQAKALGLTDTELTPRQIADRCTAAVAGLDTYATQADHSAGKAFGSASAFFISPDGLAVTCYHSIEGTQYATVTLITGETYPVETVIAYDPGMDLAILQVSPISVEGLPTTAFACLEVTGTEELYPGDAVYALGNPLGVGFSISDGIVSAVYRWVERYSLPCILNTASISQGSSGGALLNGFGHVVGITTGAYTYGNEMYLAIPADPIPMADLTAPGMTLEEVFRAEANR